MFYIRYKNDEKIIEMIGDTDDKRGYVHDYENDKNCLTFLPFWINGKNYEEKKNSLRNIAIDFQNAISESSNEQLSINEWCIVTNWFRKNGKRYGLLKEFRENAIC